MMLLCRKAILARGARAERKAGEMLKQLERGKTGGDTLHSKVEYKQPPSEYREILTENEIPNTTAFRWQHHKQHTSLDKMSNDLI